MFFVPMVTAQPTSQETETNSSTVQRQQMFYACPNEADAEWVNSRDTLECNRVPCACRVAMGIQLRQSSVTPPPSPKGLVSRVLTGGARLVARLVTTS
jgi:hypothetical protein